MAEAHAKHLPGEPEGWIEGVQLLSDHFGIVADVNLRSPRCSDGHSQCGVSGRWSRCLRSSLSFRGYPSESYFVPWTNNLTVFEPGILTNVDPVDNDCPIINCQDDELGRMKVRVTRAGADLVAPLVRGLPFSDFDQGDQVDLRPYFPTIRFLSDEQLEIEFTEFDTKFFTGDDDYLRATLLPLPSGAPATPVRPTVMSGANGEYVLRGVLDHFSRHTLPTCPLP